MNSLSQIIVQVALLMYGFILGAVYITVNDMYLRWERGHK